jgi:biopolymer transport protein ExbB/TolQ
MTTAAGLIVGIPAYAAYRYIQSRIENLTEEMEETALDLMRAIDQKPAVAAETAA